MVDWPDWLEDKEWSAYPFVPAGLTFVFLLLSLVFAGRLQQAIRSHLAGEGLKNGQLDEVRDITADFSTKLTLYAGLLPLAAVLASTILNASAVNKAGALAVFVILMVIGFVVVPFVLLAKPGELAAEFIGERLPPHEALLQRLKVKSYLSLLTWLYILAVVGIQLAIAVIALPSDNSSAGG